MTDFIKLLPDSVANQIAAGEVIQRPASVVKELLENSIDAKSDVIKLYIKNAGKTLIQVVDNGTGMSDIDARLCFERHATSKIKEAGDLFKLKTLGFRGEALASIAAIAHVELITKTENDNIGTKILIEGSKLINQEAISYTKGSSFSVRNLFYNVPARRNFLKSDQIEIRHIFEELNRVALVNPGVEFYYYSNDKISAHYRKGNLKQRIIQVAGKQFEENLLPIEISTEYVNITGFIGKPEIAKKTKGEQYFFVNNRFIRHPYLNHAVEQAFKDLIPDSSSPRYFIYLTVNEADIDVNIHPTKTEVKFQNSQLMYSTLRTAVKHSLGKFSTSPTLNFNTEPAFETNFSKDYIPKPPTVSINPDYNPFKNDKNHKIKPNVSGWQTVFTDINIKSDELLNNVKTNTNKNIELDLSINKNIDTDVKKNIPSFFFQINNKYIITFLLSGILVIDQQKAHQRIIYEQIINKSDNEIIKSQRLLFPKTLEFSVADSEILLKIIDELNKMGIEISFLGNNNFALTNIPINSQNIDIKDFINEVISYTKETSFINPTEFKTEIAHKMAINSSIKYGDKLSNEAMQGLIDKLFSCENPNLALNGTKIFCILNENELDNLFNK